MYHRRCFLADYVANPYTYAPLHAYPRNFGLDSMKEYLQKEWRYNVAPKYQHLFDQWFQNLTEQQKLYFQAYSLGQKSPF